MRKSTFYGLLYLVIVLSVVFSMASCDSSHDDCEFQLEQKNILIEHYMRKAHFWKEAEALTSQTVRLAAHQIDSLKTLLKQK